MLGRVMKKKPAVKVGKAKYGKGLFASKRFRPGEKLGTVTGEIFDDPDYSSNYCIDLGEDHSLEPAEPFCYLNHCCVPNCKLYLDYEDGDAVSDRNVYVEVIRNVQPGAELTIDYEWPADGAIRCGCGHKKCRGWVVDPAELHLVKDAGK